MIKRTLIILSATLLIAILIAAIVVRQIVFGGTPTIHRTTHQPRLVATPCATTISSSELRAFKIDTSSSAAWYEAQFQVAGQSVPGMVKGITGDVSGEFLLTSDNQPVIMSMKVIVDLRTLDSGSPERDSHVRNDTLEVNKYPYAIFTVTDARVLQGSYPEGQNVTFKLKGDLTLHGVTHPASFDMQGQLVNNTITGFATTLIHLQDYKMRTPITTAVVPVAVSKNITLTLQFTAKRENCIHAA
jgi:polyisoprenoid-binding protein YceI